jgi:hypothetical protein
MDLNISATERHIAETKDLLYQEVQYAIISQQSSVNMTDIIEQQKTRAHTGSAGTPQTSASALGLDTQGEDQLKRPPRRTWS